jgi:hypothetical protein
MVEVSAINFEIQGSIPGNSRLSPLEKLYILGPKPPSVICIFVIEHSNWFNLSGHIHKPLHSCIRYFNSR